VKRKATAQWTGELKSGHGKISTESGVLKDVSYSFTTRFEEESGTNPEELIAAAHAGCFSMAFAGELNGLGIIPESIETRATVQLEMSNGAWTVVRMHLDTHPKVGLADRTDVQAAAVKAKENCPISRLLKTAVTMEVNF
jgi:lipoyl-dependent peroxiredoxin